jgi:hypothetical protein
MRSLDGMQPTVVHVVPLKPSSIKGVLAPAFRSARSAAKPAATCCAISTYSPVTSGWIRGHPGPRRWGWAGFTTRDIKRCRLMACTGLDSIGGICSYARTLGRSVASACHRSTHHSCRPDHGNHHQRARRTLSGSPSADAHRPLFC